MDPSTLERLRALHVKRENLHEQLAGYRQSSSSRTHEQITERNLVRLEEDAVTDELTELLYVNLSDLLALAEAAPVLPDADRMRRMLLNIEQHIRSLLTPAQAEAMNIGAGTDLDYAVFRVLSRLEDLEEAAPVRPTCATCVNWTKHGGDIAAEFAHAATGDCQQDELIQLNSRGVVTYAAFSCSRYQPAPPSGGTAGQE